MENAGSSELRAALRLSLQITPFDKPQVISGAVFASESSNTRFEGIIDRIIFSRRFIISYQVVLLCLLALFAARHWTYQLEALRRRQTRGQFAIGKLQDTLSTGSKARFLSSERKAIENDGYDSQSSRSTLARTPPARCSVSSQDDRTPLLVPENAPRSRLTCTTRAWLMYQPRPIPVVNKTLPTNGTSLAILLFLALQIFYVFYKVPMSIPTLFVFADRTSLLFVANLPLLYLFAAKNQPVKFLTGYSYEVLNIFHRRIGEIMCFHALLHSFGMVGVWYTLLRPTGSSLARFLFTKINLLGIGTFFAYELLYFTSLASFRQRWYELFLFFHVSLQFTALVLLWFHHHGSRPYVGAALVIFLIDKAVYRMSIKSTKLQASLKVQQDGQTATLLTTVPLTQKRRFWSRFPGSGITSGWRATEHVFLTVPSISRKHVLQAHPFTIASKAPVDGDLEGDLRLIIRAQVGFSNDLLKYARRHNTATVLFDGPYGSKNTLDLLQSCDISVIVVGGSGIAVGWPLVWAAEQGRSMGDDLESPASKPVPGRILFVWVVRYQTHFSWIGSAQLQGLRDIGVDVMLPSPTVEAGHPNIPNVIRSWIVAHDHTPFTREPKIGVVCSGPDEMNRAIQNACSSMVCCGRDVHVEIEKFGW